MVRLHEANDGKTLEVRVSGSSFLEDYQQFVPEFERLLKQRGKLNLLLEMAEFHGWEAVAVWDDLKFDLKHFSDIGRLAMVGDKKWEKAMSIVCRLFTTARIRYFDRATIGEARFWLAGGDTTTSEAQPLA